MNDETKIPIRWLFVLLSASGAGLMLAQTIGAWQSKIEAKIEINDVTTKQLKESGDELNKTLQSIDRRLSRIEGAMGIRREIRFKE